MIDRDIATVLSLSALAKLEAGHGEPGGHGKTPKGYPDKSSEYADPKRKAYPIDRKHIHAAITYFGKYAHRYSPEERKRIAGRILNAAKKFGIEVGKNSEVREAAQSTAPLAGAAQIFTDISEGKIEPRSALKLLMDYLEHARAESVAGDGDIPGGEL